MHYAAADWVGVLIFIGVIIFQVVSGVVKSVQKPAQRPQAPQGQRRAPQRPRDPGNEPLDPFEELMEALGNKPRQTPPPQQQPVQRRVSPPPVTAAPSPARQSPPPTFQQTAPAMTSAQGETARIEAELARQVSKPVFETSIGSQMSESEKAAANIARISGASQTVQAQSAYNSGARTSPLSDLVSRLRNPADIRRAIVLNEILGTPVGLRE